MSKRFTAGLLAGAAFAFVSAGAASVFLLSPPQKPVPPSVPTLVPENAAKAAGDEQRPQPPQRQTAPRTEEAESVGDFDAGHPPTGTDSPPPEPVTALPRLQQEPAEQISLLGQNDAAPDSPGPSPAPVTENAPRIAGDAVPEPPATLPSLLAEPSAGSTSAALDSPNGAANTLPAAIPALTIILFAQSGDAAVMGRTFAEGDEAPSEEVVIVEDAISAVELELALNRAPGAKLLDVEGLLDEKPDLAALVLAANVGVVGPSAGTGTARLITADATRRQIRTSLDRAVYTAAQSGRAIILAPDTTEVQQALADWRLSEMAKRVRLAPMSEFASWP